VEGRQQQPALAQVLAAVEQQDRAVAEQRLQDRVAAPGEEVLGVGGEDGLDRLRVGGQDRRPVRKPQREVVAVAALAVVEEGDRLQQEAAEQQRLRRRRARGQGRDGRGGGRGTVDRQFNSAGVLAAVELTVNSG
jgi:hypothetical protein